MAAEPHGSTPDFDMTHHEQTWNTFCKLVLYSVIFIIIVLAGMAYFLT